MSQGAIGPFASYYGPPLQELRRHWGLYLSIGIILVILGIIAISAAVATTLVSVAIFGWILVISGGVLAGHAFWTRTWGGFFVHLLAAIFYVIVGLLIAAHPAASALSLTLLLAAFFMVYGIFRIVGSLMIRFPSWGWVLFNGIISLILGILIWARWPYSAFWVIGAFIGIDLLLNGWSFIMLSLTARAALPRTT